MAKRKDESYQDYRDRAIDTISPSFCGAKWHKWWDHMVNTAMYLRSTYGASFTTENNNNYQMLLRL